jgi:hypothetical protein
MKPIPVALTEKELQSIAALAFARNDKKERRGVKSRKVDTGMGEGEAHYIGLKAELAVSKLLGVGFDKTNTLKGDDGKDIVYRGLRIDVKCSQLDLKFRPGTFTADVAILVQPLRKGMHIYAGDVVVAEQDENVKKAIFAWANVLVVGWVSRERFEAEHVIRNFGYNDVEFMGAGDLSPMEGLRDYAESKKNSMGSH